MRLAADNWCVKTNDRIYGPYTSAQLRKFAHEGRLAAWSLIAPAGSRAWREAREENAFAGFFGGPGADAAQNAKPSFGRRDDPGQDEPAAAADDQSKPIRIERKNKADIAPKAPAGPANFVIIFDVVNAAASRVESAMMSLGPAFRLADNVWTVNCEMTAVGVRNALSPYLRPRESIFVIDSTHGRTSWQNYAPETHAKISAAWQTGKK